MPVNPPLKPSVPLEEHEALKTKFTILIDEFKRLERYGRINDVRVRGIAIQALKAAGEWHQS